MNTENAIIISEGDHLGKIFFKDLYQTMKLNIFEYTFDEHDETFGLLLVHSVLFRLSCLQQS